VEAMARHRVEAPKGEENQTRILILAITEELLAKFLYLFLIFFLS
jgi:hypothetical protein